jgi:hypothetical protein
MLGVTTHFTLRSSGMVLFHFIILHQHHVFHLLLLSAEYTGPVNLLYKICCESAPDIDRIASLVSAGIDLRYTVRRGLHCCLTRVR